MFVVDLLHEFELGVWKAVFAHLLRLLYAQGGSGIQKINERYGKSVFLDRCLCNHKSRYRDIPTFGHDTIRKFVKNVSGMSKLAARDFEDLLQVKQSLASAFFPMLINFQCAIPVFDRLFEPHNNTIVMDLLFELATWHALAKLRLHTESTVCALETSTTRLGAALRRFQSTICEEFVTRELPSEEAARGRRSAAKAKLKPQKPSKGKEPETSTRKKKKDSTLRRFNLSCYKPHSLGDYAKTIRLLGASDGYSTQTVSFG